MKYSINMYNITICEWLKNIQTLIIHKNSEMNLAILID